MRASSDDPFGIIEIVTSQTAYWDSQAETFDEQPDHGLRDPAVRDAWRKLLLAYPAGQHPLTIPG